MCLTPKVLGKYKVVACGKCIDCLKQKSRVWAFRCCLEASLYKKNCVITLTYNEDNLPEDKSVSKKDFQDFIKRLRDRIGYSKVRYFGCGEYGSAENTCRPHYHIILFNYDFEDKRFFKFSKKGNIQYRSPLLEDLWKFGYSTIGDLDFETALYTAIYLQVSPKDGRKKPFVLMSKRPGIGAKSLKKDFLYSDKIYYKGNYIKIPRYFLDLLSKDFPDLVEQLKDKRERKMLSRISFDRLSADYDFNNRLCNISYYYNFFGSNTMQNYFNFDFNPLSYYSELENSKIIYKNFLKSIDK